MEDRLHRKELELTELKALEAHTRCFLSRAPLRSLNLGPCLPSEIGVVKPTEGPPCCRELAATFGDLHHDFAQINKSMAGELA